MFFVLHHSQGALLFSADDESQVIEWSKRQLGDRAGITSVMSSDATVAESMVERSGTGIEAGSSLGCKPLAALSADLTQGVSLKRKEEERFSGVLIEHPKSARAPIWH